MDTYLLWFDDDAKTLVEEKVRRAAKRFSEKYGKTANLCLVHHSMMPAEANGKLIVEGITVRAWKSVVQSHLLIGVEDGSSLVQPVASSVKGDKV